MFDREEIARAAALRAAWEAGELHAFLERRPESRSEYQTLSGLPLKRVYTAEDVKDLRHEDLGLPGQYPSRASARARTPTAASGISSSRGRRGSAWTSTCRPSWATTRTIRARWAR